MWRLGGSGVAVLPDDWRMGDEDDRGVGWVEVATEGGIRNSRGSEGEEECVMGAYDGRE